MEYFFRQLFAALIVSILLAFSFAFVYKVARTSSEIAREFPVVDCEAIRETYGDKLQRYAVADYDFVVQNEGLPSSGALKCFCSAELKRDYNYAVTSSYGHPGKVQICEEYEFIIFEVFVWLNSLKYFITGVNVVLRLLCI